MNNAIIILGMHRSGTSCLTGCLKNSGLHLGDVSESNKYNKKGNQENKEVFRLNEEVLNYNNGGWNKPPIEELKWSDNHATKRNQILQNYNKLLKPWGIKDPRMLITYDFWKDHLPKHAIVGSFRHPVAVAKSLTARKHPKLAMTFENALSLWKIYNEKLIELYEQIKFPIINFDLERNEYLSKIEIITKKLKLMKGSSPDFFDSELVNHKQHNKNCCPSDIIHLYKKLQSFSL